MAKKSIDEKKPFYKRWWFIAIVIIFVLGIIGNLMDDSNNESTSTAQSSSKKTETSKKETGKSSAKKVKKSVASSSSVSSAKKVSSSTSSDVNSKNVEQANAAISERLSQAQGWANGTLDSNGNPTNSGTPNSAYNWAKIVTSIKYAENELTIYVNKDYVGMSKTQFANYMYTAENSALVALNEANIINENTVKSGLYTRVFDGDTKLAQSKISDRHQFKINQ